MAGAEFKITDEISSSIFIKLEKLSKDLKILDDDFKRTSNSYADFASKLAIQINASPGNLSELDKKARNTNRQLRNSMKPKINLPIYSRNIRNLLNRSMK